MKRITLIFAIIFLIGVTLLISSFKPTPNSKRNVSTTDIMMTVNIPDEANRKAIVRTYKAEEFNNFNERKLTKIKDKVGGSIEGDIPALYLKDGKGILNFSFQKNQTNVSLDDVPDIKIVAFPTIGLDIVEGQKKRVINEQLNEDENGMYFYEIQRYYTQYEKWFMESIFIEVRYKIDGNEYVSVFALNTTNAEDGVDFFENETLSNPIEPKE